MGLDVEAEGEVIRLAAEDILKAGEVYRPTVRFFEDETLKGELVIRDVNGEADKRAAFTEACLLVPYLRADEIILSFDDFVSTQPGVSAEDDPNRQEAVCVIVAAAPGAIAMIMPYTRDESGNFEEWGMRQDDASPTNLDDNMIYTLAHFMQHKTPTPKYTQVLTHTLKQRGHEVKIMDTGNRQSKFVP